MEVAGKVTFAIESPWRTIGNVTPEFWRARLVAVQSPIAHEAQATYEQAFPHTALCLAMLEVESEYARRFNRNIPSNRNPLNLRPPDGDGYMAFPTYAMGIQVWRNRITSPAYKDGIYARTESIYGLVNVYAPAFDDNDPKAYSRIIVRLLNQWGVTPTEAPLATPATLDYSRLPVPVIIDLIPESQKNQNPGIPMDPEYGTWHETANYASGADALMHQRWINSGASGTQTSWHFTVDDKRIVQHLPLNRVGWHAGDGAGPGNYKSIGVECCTNSDGDLAKAQENTAALFGLLRAEGIITVVVQHNHWSGKDCPRLLRQGKAITWSQAQTRIADYATKYGKPVPPAPVEPSPIWWKPGTDWGPQARTNDGALAWAFLGEVKAKRNVPIRRDAHKDAPVVYHLKAGSRVRIVGTHVAANKVRWAFVETEPGKYGRALLSAFEPYRWPTV